MSVTSVTERDPVHVKVRAIRCSIAQLRKQQQSYFMKYTRGQTGLFRDAGFATFLGTPFIPILSCLLANGRLWVKHRADKRGKVGKIKS